MISFILCILFTVQTYGLHILPCEPGDPGPLGCDQFVANGGQLGGGQEMGPRQSTLGGNLRFSGPTSSNMQQTNRFVDPTAQFVDPTQQFIDPTQQFLDPTQQFIDPTQQFMDPTQQFMDPTQQFMDPTQQFMDPTQQFMDPTQQFMDPTQQFMDQTQQFMDPTQQFMDPTQQFMDPTQQFMDPTQQFMDPTQQFLDPTQQFIDPTQLVDPTQLGNVGPGQIDQSGGAFPPGLDFVGKQPPVKPFKFGKNKKPFKSGVIKKKIGYPKAISKKGIMKKYLKGKFDLFNSYGKYRSMPNKYYKKVIPKAYGSYPKSYKFIGLKRIKYPSLYSGYRKPLKRKGYRNFGYSRRYPKFGYGRRYPKFGYGRRYSKYG